MNDVKVRKNRKSGSIAVWYKLGKDEGLNRMEADILRKGDIRGLEPVYTQEGLLGGTSLYFHVAGKRTLKEFMSMPISGRVFFDIVLQCAGIVWRCESRGIRTSNLELDPDRVFIDPQGRISMLYWPVLRIGSQSRYTEFFRDLGTLFRNRSEENELRNRYICIFKARSEFELNEFIRKVKALMRETLRQEEDKEAG